MLASILLRSRCHAHPGFLPTLRRYVTSPAARRIPPKVAPRPRITAESRQQMEKLKSIELADKLYSSGERLIYHASRRLTVFRAQCFTLAVFCMGTAGWLVSDGMLDAEHMKKHQQHWSIRVAYYIGVIFLATVAGGLTLWHSGYVHSVSLVKKMDQTFLEVVWRGRLPFLRYRRVIRPYDMYADSSVVQWRGPPRWMMAKPLDQSSPLAATTSVLQNSVRTVSKIMYYIFTAAKTFINREGIVPVDFEVYDADKEKSKVVKLQMDLGGRYATSRDHQHYFWHFVQIRKEEH